jgi:hypothetical protein
MREVLGMNADEITALETAGVVGAMSCAAET